MITSSIGRSDALDGPTPRNIIMACARRLAGMRVELGAEQVSALNAANEVVCYLKCSGSHVQAHVGAPGACVPSDTCFRVSVGRGIIGLSAWCGASCRTEGSMA